ncbi:gluconeogenesis factor YvcK family protein [Heliorestis convoluta]|uniref:gluconeogenesis factor YvcK family protein n=1 Tax=Heliorestis convoluta TaxID=356322 RepID=UPI001FAA4D2E|nr:gluconeogenesis factor YvcK family protein [Heliorestis convoluta]
MKVKRWMALSFIGIFLAGASASLFFEGPFFGYIESLILQLTQHLGPNALTLVSLLLFGSGLFLHIFGFIRMVRSIYQALAPEKERKLVEVLYRRRSLERGPKLVVIGGGTGLSVLLRGLKEYTSNITAIVTVSDDGGSSGRLRDDLGIVAPGDIRNCLVALADTESEMDQVLNYRFTQGETLAGHNLGNLLLAGAAHSAGSFEKAVALISNVLAVRGQVLPSTLSNVTLCALLQDGRYIRGETAITSVDGAIRSVFLDPEDCQPLPQTLAAIEEADAIIIGPGSLYTSLLPNLLVQGIAESLGAAEAPKIYVCNVMTQPGETDGYRASQHLQAINQHCRSNIIDHIIVNREKIPHQLLRKYEKKGQKPVAVDYKNLERQGCQVVQAKLINIENLVRHDPVRLSQTIMDLVMKEKEQQKGIHWIDLLLFKRKRSRSYTT